MEQERIIQLVERTQEGDRQAFEELYRETSKTVYFICISFLNNEEDARDAMQDTYVTAYQKLEQLQEKGKFIAWISRIAVNKCKKHLLKNAPVLMEPESMTNMATESNEGFLPEEYITQKEKRKIVMDIMRKKLSDIQYQTVILFYFNNLSVVEIADIMECPPGTVTYRLSISRAKIKEGVLEYEQESKDKLYSFAPIPFLAGLLTAEAGNIQVPDVWSNIVQGLDLLCTGVAGESGQMVEKAVEAGGVTSGKEAVTKTARKVVQKAATDTMKGSGVFMGSMKFKLIIAAICVVLAGGGIVAVIISQSQKAAEEEAMQNLIELLEENEKEKEQESLTAKEDAEEEKAQENNKAADNDTGEAESPEKVSKEEVEESDLEKEFEELAGSITDISFDFASKPLLLADNRLYYNGKEVMSFQEELAYIDAFSCIEVGEVIAAVTQSGTLSYWKCGSVFGDVEPELFFRGFPFDASKDFIIDASGKSVKMMHVAENGTAVITYYNVKDDKTLEAHDTRTVEGYKDWSEEKGEYLNIPVRSIVALQAPTYMGGSCMYGLTENNELYIITEFGTRCEMKYIASDVQKAYCEHDVLGTTIPVYSKVGDVQKLYSKVRGEKMGDSEDDPELAFVMPDGHTVEEVVNMFGDVDVLCVFEFSNGDVYYTDEVDKKAGGEYSLIKCEELSELNAQGRILKMGMPSAYGESHVYVLLDDNSVYSMKF